MGLKGDREFFIIGYIWLCFGEFCYFLCCLVLFYWVVFYILILVDIYNNCEVGGIDNFCFFGNNVIFGIYEFNGKVCFFLFVLLFFYFGYVLVL